MIARTLLALAVIGAAQAIAGSAGASAPPPSTPHAHPFADGVAAADADAIVATLNENAALYTPIFDAPIEGRDRLARLFTVLAAALDDVVLLDEISTPDRFVLRFSATIDGEPIEFTDVLELDADGRVDTIVVSTRLVAGTQALANALAPHLADILQ